MLRRISESQFFQAPPAPPESEQVKAWWRRLDQTEQMLIWLSRGLLRLIVLMACLFLSWLAARILYRLYENLDAVL